MADDRTDHPTCGHPGPAAVSSICPHLAAAPLGEIAYHRWFTGKGIECELLCAACVHVREGGAPGVLTRVCAACMAEVIFGGCDGIRGCPEAKERPGDFDLRRHSVEIPAGLPRLIDLAAVASKTPAAWMGLCGDGSLVAMDLRAGRFFPLARVRLPEEPARKPWDGRVLRPRLHVSQDGRFAAVVNDYGRRGLICDIATGRITLELDGGEHHPETVPFSLCFAEFDGKPVVVHRTDWNRLDASDPETGRLLSARENESVREGKPVRLDYFHGRLHVSPDGSHVLDDGWVWHPVGVVTVFSLWRWLHDDPWETEAGHSRRPLADRGYYWDHGMCWIDSGRLAIGGIGDDDEQMVPGVRIFDVHREFQETHAFAGPTGELFSDGRRLFASDPSGLSLWDIDEGCRIGRVAEFHPTHHHREAREFAELRAGRIDVAVLGE